MPDRGSFRHGTNSEWCPPRENRPLLLAGSNSDHRHMTADSPHNRDDGIPSKQAALSSLGNGQVENQQEAPFMRSAEAGCIGNSNTS